jgi:hypothetical protein
VVGRDYARAIMRPLVYTDVEGTNRNFAVTHRDTEFVFSRKSNPYHLLKVTNEARVRVMSVKSIVVIAISGFCMIVGSAFAGTPSPDGAQVYIISPADGETVSSPVAVRFGLKGMGVAPAGIDKPHTGHHHLLIDVKGDPAFDSPLPADAHHIHFGGGQTEATVELSPGKHTLQLIMGNQNHVPHSPPVISKEITIVVK